MSDLMRGKINRFSLDALIHMMATAGIRAHRVTQVLNAAR
ncbi:MAG: hypothetical protein ACYCZ6_01370 [Polaromonas sp.]